MEKQLRAAGIPVLSKEKWSATPGGPYLYVWETREVGTVGIEKLPTVQQSIAGHVETFIAAYRVVNPASDERLALQHTR